MEMAQIMEKQMAGESSLVIMSLPKFTIMQYQDKVQEHSIVMGDGKI